MLRPENCTESVTIELAGDGMIVRDPSSANAETESYIIPFAVLYTDQTDRWVRPIPLSRLWLIWFCSLPVLAALLYLSVLVLR